MLCPSYFGYDTLGDCVIMFINAFALFVEIVCILYGYLFVYRAHYIKQAHPSLLTQSLLANHSEIDGEVRFVGRVRFPGGALLLRVVQIIGLFEVILCVIFLIHPSHAHVDDDSNQKACDFTAYYLSIAFQICGWCICVLVNTFALKYLGLACFYSSITFGMFTCGAFGIVCVSSAVEDLSASDSIGVLAYFCVCLVAVLVWVYALWVADSPRRGANKRHGSTGTDSTNTSNFKQFMFPRENVNLANVVSSNDEERGKVSSFWNFGRNGRQSVDEESASSSAHSSAHSKHALNQAVTSTDARDDSRTDSVNSNSHNTHTSSKSIEYLRQLDLDGLSIHSHVQSSTGSNTAPPPSAHSLKRNPTLLRTQLSLASKTHMHSSEFTLSVVDFSYVTINARVVVVYKIGLKESQAVRIVLKRRDEISYLREKLLNDFPQTTQIAPVPVPPPQGSTSTDYDIHKQQMSEFLETLITHPILGSHVMRDLRASIQSNASAVANSSASSSSLSEGSGPRAESDTCAPVPTLFPLLIACEDRVEAQVINWTALPSASNKKELKTYYEVQVRLRRHHQKSLAGMYEHVPDECNPDSVIWTLRKRHRQFASLNAHLQRSLGEDTRFPVKASKRRPKVSSREYDAKLNENVLALDGFLQGCLRLRPLPPCICAFLETDVVLRQYGFDLLLTEPTDDACPPSAACATTVMLLRTTLPSFAERQERAQALAQSFDSNSFSVAECKPLNQLVKPFNKKVMLFSRQSGVVAGAGRDSAAMTNAQVVPANEARESGVDDGSDDDEEEQGRRGVVIYNDGRGLDTGEDDGEATGPQPANDLRRSRSLSDSGSSDVDDRDTAGDGDDGDECKDDVPSIQAKSKQIKEEGHTTSVQTGLGTRVQKKTSMASMFGFMSSSSSAGGQAAQSLKGLSVEQVAEWPLIHLTQLLQLLKFIQSDSLTKLVVGGCKMTHAAGKTSDINHFTPGLLTSDDYLLPHESLLLSNTSKHPKSSSTSASSTTATGIQPSRALWLSQYRLRTALLCTTAFVEWCEQLSLLQTLDLKVAKSMTNDQKLCFCLNLYNLLSLFASIVVPWPSLGDTCGRAQWARNVRLTIGGSSAANTISLLQLEYAVIRANLTNLDLPSIFLTEIPYPSPTDIKSPLSFLLPSGLKPDPRWGLAMWRPFISSPPLRLYRSSELAATLKECVAAYVMAKVYVLKGVVYLPKFLRIYHKDFDKWKVPLPQVASDGNCLNASNIQTHVQRYGFGSVAGSVAGSVYGDETGSVFADNFNADPILPLGGGSPARGLHSQASSRITSRTGGLQEAPTQGINHKFGESSSDWDVAGNDRSYPTERPNKSALLGKRAGSIGEELLMYSDIVVGEYELIRLCTLLKVGVDVRDRKHRMRVFKACFLGSDAVRCFLASGDAKSVPQALAICDMLILYGFIEHVTRDHWMKDQELFYAFTDADGLNESFNSSVSASHSSQILANLLPFLEEHLKEYANFHPAKQAVVDELVKQLQKAVQQNVPLHYLCEDYCFCLEL